MDYRLTEDETREIEEAFKVSIYQKDRHSLIDSIIASKIAEVLEENARKYDLSNVDGVLDLDKNDFRQGVRSAWLGVKQSLEDEAELYQAEADLHFTGRSN